MAQHGSNTDASTPSGASVLWSASVPQAGLGELTASGQQGSTLLQTISVPSTGSEPPRSLDSIRQLALPQIAQLLYKAGLLREVILPEGAGAGEAAVDAPAVSAARGKRTVAPAVASGPASATSTSARWFLDPTTLPPLAFTHLTYDTRQAQPGSLLFVKGRFREEFFAPALEAGLAGYVAEHPYDVDLPAIIVTDALAAMSLLAAEFYGHPERELTVVGLTGTKGKTTTAHLMHAVLARATQGRAAMFSSNHLYLDGHSFEPATLTTPESLDTFHMMRQARDNGMTHLVMEVSSQAYKVGRVWGLHFDVAVFLNISPDHISDIEHPTFEDYFFCKRQLLRNASAVVLNAGSDYAELLATEARMAGASLTTYGWEAANSPDLTLTSTREGFTVREQGTVLADSQERPLRLRLAGSFNEENAAAAIAVARVLGFDDAAALRAVEEVAVSGRMERVSAPGLTAYIDFAHNYLSTSALLDEVDREFAGRPTWRLLVSGSTGGKAVNRREGIVTAANGRVDAFLFTEDDQDAEPAEAIAAEMASYVSDPGIPVRSVFPRTRAIEEAVAWAREAAGSDRDVVLLLIGKGDQTYNVDRGRKVPFAGDAAVLREALAGEED